MSSCKEKTKPPYAIKDFSQTLQTYLNKMVESGVVSGFGDIINSCDSIISKKELVRLASSEHPILRAEALLMMVNRENEDYSDIFMSHLSDTANVIGDGGEFGYTYKNVSDLFLEKYNWRTEKERNKAVEEVVMNHNYLSLAYKVLLDFGSDEKYYKIIKEMTQRKRRYDYELDYALLALARFKKKEDVPLIKRVMMDNVRFLDNISFWLIKEFPDDSYWEVVYRYAERYYLSNSSYYDDMDYEKSNEFIHFLVSFKNDSAAKILNYLIDESDKRNYLCQEIVANAKHNLFYAIWENKCEAYAGLIPRIQHYIKEQEKGRTVFAELHRNQSPDFNSHRSLLHKKEGPFPFIKWKYHYSFW